MSELDPLSTFPELRSLRDALIAKDPDARKAGGALITRALLAAALNIRIPDDRLVKTEEALRITGLEMNDFLLIAEREQIRPARELSRATYWRAADVYRLLDGHG